MYQSVYSICMYMPQGVHVSKAIDTQIHTLIGHGCMCLPQRVCQLIWPQYVTGFWKTYHLHT